VNRRLRAAERAYQRPSPAHSEPADNSYYVRIVPVSRTCGWILPPGRARVVRSQLETIVTPRLVL